MDYTIDKYVEIPKTPKISRISRGSKYPFSLMEVGDSFAADTKISVMRASVYIYGKKTGKKFIVRTDNEENTRVWRTE
jgi:hypothetical protein